MPVSPAVRVFGPFCWLPDEKSWSHGKLIFTADQSSAVHLDSIDRGLAATELDEIKDSLQVRVVQEGEWEWLEFYFGTWRRCMGVAKVRKEIGVYEVQTIRLHALSIPNCLVRLLRSKLKLDQVLGTPWSEECRNAIAALEAKYEIELVSAEHCERVQHKCALLSARVAELETTLGQIAETATTMRGPIAD